MPVNAYKSSSTRRIFTNLPFKRGMLYDDLTINENMSKVIANLDIPSSGDYAQPRPAFVNAAIDTFYKVTLNYPTVILKQNTSLAKTFIIGFEQTVNENNYVNDIVNSNAPLTTPKNFGIKVLENQTGFEERERRDGVFLIKDILNVFDGDTYEFIVEKTDDGVTTFDFPVRVRLLGVDTPELGPVFEPFSDVALAFVLELLKPPQESQTFGEFTIIDRYIQYEPATVSTDRTDSQRALAYVILEMVDEESNTYRYTLTELLLKAGLGVIQADPDYIYYDRFIEAYEYAKENELGIHPLEEIEEVIEGVPGWDPLSDPVIEPIEGETEVSIMYDENTRTFKTEFEIENDTGYPVLLVVQLGSQTRQVALNEAETEPFEFPLFVDVDYRIRARFFIADQQLEKNPSQWTELFLGRVTLNLDATSLSDSLLEIVQPLSDGFEYRLEQNFMFSLFIRATYLNEVLFEGFYNPDDVITGTYTSPNWPVFAEENVFINTRYETPASLGAIRTVTITTLLETQGKSPILEEVNINGLNLTFKITNENNFDTTLLLVVSGPDNETITLQPETISADDDVTKTIGVDKYSTAYQVTATFRDINEPSILSGSTSIIMITGLQPADVTASFNTAGGSANPTSQSGPPPFTVDAPTQPTRTGYTFAGWNNGLGFNASIVISGNTTFTAQWTANTYTVSFDPNGGNQPSFTSKTVTYDSTYGTLPTVSRSNHTFNGWFTASSGGTRIFTSTVVKITNAQTLYAQWTFIQPVTQYTITWVPNGGTWSDGTTNNKTTTVNENTTPSQPQSISRTNFNFDGWSPALASATGNATYTAQWSSACDAAGTYIREFCDGTFLVIIEADGNCGERERSRAQVNGQCGYVAPTTQYNLAVGSTLFDTRTNSTFATNAASLTVQGISTTSYNQNLNENTSISMTAPLNVSSGGVTFTFGGWRNSGSSSNLTSSLTYSTTLTSNRNIVAYYSGTTPAPVVTTALSARVGPTNFGPPNPTSVPITVAGTPLPALTTTAYAIRTKEGTSSQSVSLSVPTSLISGVDNYTFSQWRRPNGSTLSTSATFTHTWSNNETIEVIYNYAGSLGGF